MKKLKLNKETISLLNYESMMKIPGGEAPTVVSNCGNKCNPGPEPGKESKAAKCIPNPDPLSQLWCPTDGSAVVC